MCLYVFISPINTFCFRFYFFYLFYSLYPAFFLHNSNYLYNVFVIFTNYLYTVWTEMYSAFPLQVFTGNSNTESVVRHDLQHSIVARYLRFIPLGWSEEGQIGLRIEIYGCLYCELALSFSTHSLLAQCIFYIQTLHISPRPHNEWHWLENQWNKCSSYLE